MVSGVWCGKAVIQPVKLLVHAKEKFNRLYDRFADMSIIISDVREQTTGQDVTVTEAERAAALKHWNKSIGE